MAPSEVERIWRAEDGQVWRVTVATLPIPSRDEVPCTITFREGANLYRTSCRPVQYSSLLDNGELQQMLGEAIRQSLVT